MGIVGDVCIYSLEGGVLQVCGELEIEGFSGPIKYHPFIILTVIMAVSLQN